MHRHFSTELEALADKWVEMAATSDEWIDKGPYGVSESKPFEVERDGLRGIAKPGEKKGDNIVRAAHEKIAADLAYHLKLPIPPVVLWDMGEQTLSGRERYVVISAWAFSQVLSWGQIQNQLTKTNISVAIKLASAMFPFDTWISIQDRKPAHVLVNGSMPEGEIQLAFIDFAFSMTKAWGEEVSDTGPADWYWPFEKDNGTIKEIANKIENFDENLLSEIVSRIPTEWLQEPKCKSIINNLLNRKMKIKTLVGLNTREEK